MSKRKLFVTRWFSLWVPVLALLKWNGVGPSGKGEPSSDPLTRASSPFDLSWLDDG